jgi:hypothetical protein
MSRIVHGFIEAASDLLPNVFVKGRLAVWQSRLWLSCEYTVNLGGHNEIVLMQPLDLLGLQRDRGITPTEADIRMMAFSFRELTNFLGKGKRLPEIAKPEASLDAVSFLL